MITPIVIKSGKSSMTQYRTFCCYGETRTGKSRFAGTFPNALFISDASERGWTTLETMPEDAFYHPGQGPVILPVADQQAMVAALHTAEQWVRAGYIDTVVVDSLTFYAESWLQHEIAKMLAAPGSKGIDTRSLYGALASHLSNTRVQIHKWPCHVVWLALQAPPDDNQLGGPMLSGKSRQRFPAGCDHIFRHRKYDATFEDGSVGPVFEVQTAAHTNYVGGGRDGGALPDTIPWPSFRIVAEYLGLPEFPAKQVPDAEVGKAIGVVAAAAAGTPSAPAAPAPSKANGAAPPTAPQKLRGTAPPVRAR